MYILQGRRSKPLRWNPPKYFQMLPIFYTRIYTAILGSHQFINLEKISYCTKMLLFYRLKCKRFCGRCPRPRWGRSLSTLSVWWIENLLFRGSFKSSFACADADAKASSVQMRQLSDKICHEMFSYVLSYVTFHTTWFGFINSWKFA